MFLTIYPPLLVQASCWAFSAAAAIESAYLIRFGNGHGAGGGVVSGRNGTP